MDMRFEKGVVSVVLQKTPLGGLARQGGGGSHPGWTERRNAEGYAISRFTPMQALQLQGRAIVGGGWRRLSIHHRAGGWDRDRDRGLGSVGSRWRRP